MNDKECHEHIGGRGKDYTMKMMMCLVLNCLNRIFNKKQLLSMKFDETLA